MHSLEFWRRELVLNDLPSSVFPMVNVILQDTLGLGLESTLVGE
jgi:hypothetical protein